MRGDLAFVVGGDRARQLELQGEVELLRRPDEALAGLAVEIDAEGLLARATELGIQQKTGTGDARAASAGRRKTRQQIEFALLNPLVKVGRQAAKSSPELIGKFVLSPYNASHRAFLIRSRAMLAQATAA